MLAQGIAQCMPDADELKGRKFIYITGVKFGKAHQRHAFDINVQTDRVHCSTGQATVGDDMRAFFNQDTSFTSVSLPSGASQIKLNNK